MKNFRDFLTEHYACEDGTDWVEDHHNLSLKKMWKKCKNPYFLLWVLECIRVPHKKMVKIQLNMIKGFANTHLTFKRVAKLTKKWLNGNKNSVSKLKQITLDLEALTNSMESPICAVHYQDFVYYLTYNDAALCSECDVWLSAKKLRKSIPWKTVKKYYKKNA
jgi:hypothetical protein